MSNSARERAKFLEFIVAKYSLEHVEVYFEEIHLCMKVSIFGGEMQPKNTINLCQIARASARNFWDFVLRNIVRTYRSILRRDTTIS